MAQKFPDKYAHSLARTAFTHPGAPLAPDDLERRNPVLGTHDGTHLDAHLTKQTHISEDSGISVRSFQGDSLKTRINAAKTRINPRIKPREGATCPACIRSSAANVTSSFSLSNLKLRATTPPRVSRTVHINDARLFRRVNESCRQSQWALYTYHMPR